MPHKVDQFERHSELPPGAVVLSEEQVLQTFWKTVDKWQPKSDIWPVTLYGSSILGSLGLMTGLMSTSFYHRAFNLARVGGRMTYLPATLLSAVIPPMVISLDVTQKVALGQEKCSLCLQTRAGLYQLGCGVVYPIMMSLAGSLFLAKQNVTYPLPDLKNFKELFRVILKVSRPFQLPITFFVVTNFFGAAYMIKLQQDTMPKITKEMVF